MSKNILLCLPTNFEIKQVAHDEAQQDWDDINHKLIYQDAFIAGAMWMRRKVVMCNDGNPWRE